MSCTLDELHDAYYEMLCKFSDYCENNSIDYMMHAGTLLGAVRHNDFIPWDDDVDIIMDINNFMKLSKSIRKHPIDGLFFQWIDSEKLYPMHFAKIRKNNTFMSEWAYHKLDIHKGIWMDIFVYLNKPETDFGVKVQEFLLKTFTFIGKTILYKADPMTVDKSDKIKTVKLLSRLPICFIVLIRKFLFFLIRHSGKKDSEYVRDFDYNGDHNFKEPRKCFEPTELHKFRDSEFRIPSNYDMLLKIIYGENYMTPIVSKSHVLLENVKL